MAWHYSERPLGVMKFRHAVLHSVRQSLAAELESAEVAETPAAKLPLRMARHGRTAATCPLGYCYKSRLGLKQMSASLEGGEDDADFKTVEESGSRGHAL
jgi:hypothetical protein